VKTIEGGVTAPKGYRAAGVNAGIKPGGTKKDCALVVSEESATVAGAFTTNLMKAAPIQWSEEVCRRGAARAVFINSGNANACTGARGERDAEATAATVAASLKVARGEVCVCSTGVIGVYLPMDRIERGVRDCVAQLREEGGSDAAEAIMTTDTVPKELAVEVALSGGVVRIGAMAKGSGMIAPNLATMICIITTDASVEAEDLDTLLMESVDISFNCICVDNDMSTSDAVICMANGASDAAPLEADTEDFETFGTALRDLCQAMAKLLVQDGEGATKLVEIQVYGAETDEDAKTIARAVACSDLCKTAFFGEDPNWGRIACAAGYAGVSFEPSDFALWFGEVQVVRDGTAADYSEADAAAVMKAAEFSIRLRVGSGDGSATFWTCDLSHDYVSINADYRS
jgi:glutamate N-acetyltransferase / amino-acid N-acetyltransferase